MKNVCSHLLLGVAVLSVTGLSAATPRFYVTGQIGVYAADAGTPAAYNPFYVDRAIKSGSKSFTDLSVGAELLPWLSLEAGYVGFSSFASPDFVLRPDVVTIRAETRWQTYELRGLRITPVFTVYSANLVTLRILGGRMHQPGQVIGRDRTMPGYENSSSLDNLAYHLGAGVTYNLSDQAMLEGRIVHYDFGKPESDPNGITAMTYSLGFSWRF